MPMNPLRPSQNKLDINQDLNNTESEDIFVSCTDILTEIISKSITADSRTQSISPTQSTAEKEQNITDTAAALPPQENNEEEGYFIPLNLSLSKDSFQSRSEFTSKQKLLEMFDNLHLENKLTQSYFSKIELNTMGEIAQIDNNVRLNNALALMSVDSDASFDSDNSSDDAQRFCMEDDDDFYYAGRPIYSSRPLMDNPAYGNMSNASLIAVLDFDISDNDNQEACTSSTAHTSTSNR